MSPQRMTRYADVHVSGCGDEPKGDRLNVWGMDLGVYIEAGYCTISLNVYYVRDLCITCDFVILGSPSLSAMRICTCPGLYNMRLRGVRVYQPCELYMSGFV
ncbi:hypothetical protein Hanom_Chr01g00087211 [Helianthus anomalus]